MITLPSYLSEAAAAFNVGAYSKCVSQCTQLRTGREGDPWLHFLLAFATHRHGDSVAARVHLGHALRLEPENETFKNLKQEIERGSERTVNLPEVFRCGAWCKGKTVVNVGGVITPLLQGHLAHARQVININAATTTLGERNEVDVLADAHALPMLDNASVDVVASSHTIEHLVNPLLALREWKRILRQGGLIYSCVPNYRQTFDHRRQPTSLAHLVEDLKSGNVQMDWFHAEEYLRAHDASRDLVFRDDPTGHFAEYIKAPHLNTHFHVFDLPLVYVMHQYIGFSTLACFEADISIHYFGMIPQGRMSSTAA